MNLLFVCSENRFRSPTAEAVFDEYDGVNAIGAGTNSDAETTVTGDLIEWANIILVMQKTHRAKVLKKFGEQLKGKKLVCLNIADNYEYMQAELIKILKVKVPKHVRI